MGIKLNAQANKNTQFVEDSRAATRIIVNRLFSPLKQFHLAYIFTGLFWEQRKVIKSLHSFARKVIEDRKMLRETSILKDLGNGMDRKKKALIDFLLDAKSNGQSMTDMDLIYEAITFLYTVSINRILLNFPKFHF